MSEILISPEFNKQQAIAAVEGYLRDSSIDISESDITRPWGAFFVISNSDINKFLELHFSDLKKEDIFQYSTEISPKILLVEPGQELSWQYHDRRAEIWRVINGPIGYVQSADDELKPAKTATPGGLIKHSPETRHRLIGMNTWGVLAEIWQHTDPSNPSNEDDIVRLEDAYGRS